MLTFQDFEAAPDKPRFILGAISEYRTSDIFRTAVDAQKYYERKNPEILRRLTYLQKHGLVDSKVKFHKLCSGLFAKLVKQQSQYLLGNGVTLPTNAKNMLGPMFDKALQKMGLQALVDGVNWGYWQAESRSVNRATGVTLHRIPGKLMVFRATEFMPLLDEYTGDMRAGIRFWQVAPDKPMMVELFEEDGITEYIESDNGAALRRNGEKTPYVRKVESDVAGERIADTENQPTIPVFPLYANELKQSELTPGIRAAIDAYDFISSDLVDGITQIEGLYWTLKNFGGEDAAKLLTELQQLKAAQTEDEESDVEGKVVEIPHQAKSVALELLRKQIYSDFMGLDMEAIRGGSLTNVAINVSKSDLDLKSDLFEWQCVEFVQSVLKLLGNNDVEATFKRRSITNDTEAIDCISTMISDGYIDIEEAIYMNPIILESRQKDLMKRLEVARQEKADSEFPVVPTSGQETPEDQMI